MPRNMPPANVSSTSDLVEYKISDASPVSPGAARGYIERYIHGEIYKMYPTVNSVIHSHANEVVPYSITGMYLIWVCRKMNDDKDSPLPANFSFP